MATARTCTPRLALDNLPPKALDSIISSLPPRDLASLNATARLFHAAPPGGCSPVERALRERARARGHDRALRASLSSGVRTWIEELFARERVFELACAHSSPVATDDDDVGWGFSAFVDADGGLHTCGEQEQGVEDGRLAYGPHDATGHAGMPAARRVPTRVPSLSAVRVRAVAAGRHHLLALSEAGAVYGCGYNDFGQLGLGDSTARHTLAHVRSLAGEISVCIAAGSCHSLALTAAGCAYSWGWNEDGRLGHGDKKDRLEPTRIEALEGVRVGGVSARWGHTLLLSAQGAVYSCGGGQTGRLGHGDRRSQRTPRRIEALAGVRAVHVSAGYAHSLVADAEGLVYSFGQSTSGQLGRDGGRVQPTPSRIEALAGVRAVRVYAGSETSAVLDADGSVHTFGNNGCGQLGHGRRCKASPIPDRVSTLAQARVARCAMGYCCSLFVTADGSVYSCGGRSAARGLGMGAENPKPIARIETLLTRVETAWRARVRY